MSTPSLVTILTSEQDLKDKLSSDTKKLAVLEFVKSDSQLGKYVKSELEIIAKDMEDKAKFYELDVDKFKKYAERFKVEALPAFVVMQKFVKKRHVVGTDDLKKAILDAYAKWDDSSSNNDSEQRQGAEEKSASGAESVRNNVSEQRWTCLLM